MRGPLAGPMAVAVSPEHHAMILDALPDRTVTVDAELHRSHPGDGGAP